MLSGIIEPMTVSNIEQAKRCGACGIVKRYSEFSRDRSKRDGYMYRCKECDRARNREAYARKVKRPVRPYGVGPKLCSVDGCNEPHAARGYCMVHYARVKRHGKAGASTRGYVVECLWCMAIFSASMPHARFCGTLCKQRHRDATVCNRGDRKRARYHGVEYEFIDRRKVYERDEWRCGICGGEIDRGASYPEPLSASLDHVKPMSKGGPHLYSNVQAAHWKCNQDKGADYSDAGFYGDPPSLS